ncbi:MAG TPA: hypothetical protein VNA87_06115 [Actinomycetota bacterium]|nr:hypothetical protein [Actinomycetota bacterium]
MAGRLWSGNLAEIGHCSKHAIRVVREFAEAVVALEAKDGPHFARHVVMVHMDRLSLATQSTLSTLHPPHLIESGEVYPVAPFHEEVAVSSIESFRDLPHNDVVAWLAICRETIRAGSIPRKAGVDLSLLAFGTTLPELEGLLLHRSNSPFR